MDDKQSTDSRLNAIHDDVRALANKVDRLLIGENGSQGALGRVTSVENQVGLIVTALSLAWVTLIGVVISLIPGWSKQ